LLFIAFRVNANNF